MLNVYELVGIIFSIVGVAENVSWLFFVGIFLLTFGWTRDQIFWARKDIKKDAEK